MSCSKAARPVCTPRLEHGAGAPGMLEREDLQKATALWLAICAEHKECEALLKDAARHGGRPRTPPSQRRGGRPRAATAMSSMASPETSIQRSTTAETSVAETSVAQSDVPSLPNRASSREVVEELSHFQALASADL